MSDFGKFIFIWKMPFILNGNVQEMAKRLKDAGFQGVIVKTTNGPYIYHPDQFPSWGKNLQPQHVEIFKSYGLSVWGWGFNFGKDVAGEGKVAAQEAVALNLDGHAFDIEGAFESASLMARLAGLARTGVESLKNRTALPRIMVAKAPFESQVNPAQKANILLDNFFRIAPDMRTIFCSFAMYRSPSGGTWHNRMLYEAFMSRVTYGMPMVYWWDQNPVNMLAISIVQWADIAHGKPIIPAGRLYTGDGGVATPETIKGFGIWVREHNLIGENWWHMGSGLANPSWWTAVSQLPGWEIIPPLRTRWDSLSDTGRLAYVQKYGLVDKDGYLTREP